MAFNTFATATSDIPLANLDANFTLIGAAAAVSTLYPTASTSITYGTAGTTHYLSGTGLSVAGAATVGTTLGVTGTSTMAAVNASGNINVSSSNIVLTAATGAIDMKGALTLAPASANPQIFLTDATKGSAYLQGGVNTGGTGAGDYWIFNVPTSRGLSWAVNNSTVLNAAAAGVTIPGTLGVTGAFTGTTGTFTKAAAGDVLVLTNGGATPKPMYFYSDASTMSMGTSASQGGSLLAFVSTTSAQINISGGSVQSWTTAGTNVTGTLGVTGTSGYGPRATASSTDRISVSTTATTLSTLTTGGSVGATVALFIVNGYNTGGAGNSFCDIVAFVSGAAASTISAIAKGSPAARTYSAASNLFQLAMASGTYNVAVTQFEQSC